MGDMSDGFKDLKGLSQEKRASNRDSSPQILKDKGIKFVSKNGGAHLIVDGFECVIDFWPGTGKYIVRTGPTGRGVFNLIKNHCTENESNRL